MENFCFVFLHVSHTKLSAYQQRQTGDSAHCLTEIPSYFVLE